jgi:hypothetical protein
MTNNVKRRRERLNGHCKGKKRGMVKKVWVGIVVVQRNKTQLLDEKK